MRAVCVLAAAVVMCAGCGTTLAVPTPSPAASASPSVSPPAPSPSPSASPVAVVKPGAPAYVVVTVATLWRSPQSVRAVDAPALSNPARIREWLAGLDAAAQRDLIERADSQVLLNERVDVIALAAGWAQVVLPAQSTPLDARGYPGWIPIAQLSAAAPSVTAQVATVITPTAWLLDHGLPSLEVSFGTRLAVVWVRDTIVHVAIAGGAELDVAASAVAVTAPDQAALPRSAGSVVDTLKAFMNLRYLWAGTSGFGYDCSGLTYTVFKAHGVLLPRDAQDQAQVGVAVDRNHLQPGDLVFLAAGGVVHHVAVYAGGGMLIDSPDLGRGVQLVSMSVAPYSTEFAGARRVI